MCINTLGCTVMNTIMNGVRILEFNVSGKVFTGGYIRGVYAYNYIS